MQRRQHRKPAAVSGIIPTARACLPTAFAAAMDGLGPFEPRPALAVAVSGGADSMTLAVLAATWARQRDGSTLALIVDHGLRPVSADEASITAERLTGLGIPVRQLRLSNLKHGSALAERARTMRYEILAAACRQAGILHLLLGHHAADQVETLAMRVLRGSLTHGLAGMPAVRETAGIRLLRPLLGIEPARLRSFLAASGTVWIEDPSNQNLRAMRPRLRHLLATHAPHDTGLQQAISAVGQLRTHEEAAIAVELAHRTSIRPEGFAVLSPGRISPAALSTLVRTIGGAPYPPNPARINELAAQPEPATVAGVQLVPAGRFDDGMLIVREAAAAAPPAEARPDTIWDNRFRLICPRDFPAGATIGKLGADAARFRGISDLPSVILTTLPAVRFGKFLAAVPHLGYAASADDGKISVLFTPPRPAAGASFVPATLCLTA